MIENIFIIGLCLIGSVAIGYGVDNFFIGLGVFFISVAVAPGHGIE